MTTDLEEVKTLDFTPVKLCLKIDPVLHPAHSLENIYMHYCILTCAPVAEDSMVS